MTADRGQRRSRMPWVVAPLLFALALTAGLAWLAFDATRAQRTAARRTVDDFANFAAFIIGNAAQQELERRLLYAFSGISGYDPATGAPLPDPSLIGRDRTEAQRCVASGHPPPSYARLDLRSDELTLAGSSLPDTTTAWLADTLAVEARVFRADWSYTHVFGDRHGVPVIALTLLKDSAGDAIAAYAKTSCMEVNGRSVFALAASSVTALPPSLTGNLPHDSLLTLFARDPHGHVVHESPLAWASTVFGSSGPLPRLGGLELVVDIRPDVADRLVVGGIPYGGAPMAILLLVLIAGFGGLALLQVRRQQELIRAREQFISNVSHELRTPLQQILVFAELLRMDKLRSEEERSHSIAVVERETRRLIQLVENVLTFARPARDSTTLARGRIEIEPLVRDVIQTFEPVARMSDTTIRVEARADAAATGDADAIRRIVLNLVDNAFKYGPAGQTITITIDRIEGGVVSLAVEDEGPGIPDPDRDRIWEAFRRLEREERAAIAGSGMGLSIVRDLTRGMQGEVRVESSPAGGARFVVSLPEAPAA
jgi:signal transduction histidine kinase